MSSEAVINQMKETINDFKTLRELRNNSYQFPIITPNRASFKMKDANMFLVSAPLICTVQNKLGAALDRCKETELPFVIVHLQDVKNPNRGWFAKIVKDDGKSATIRFLSPCWLNSDSERWEYNKEDLFLTKEDIIDLTIQITQLISTYESHSEVFSGSLFKDSEGIKTILTILSEEGERELFFYYSMFFLLIPDQREDTNIYKEEWVKETWLLIRKTLDELTQKIESMLEKSSIITDITRISKNAETTSDNMLVRFQKEKDRFPLEVQEAISKELGRLSYISAQNPEYAKIAEYIDIVLSLPIGIYSNSKVDIKQLENHLNTSHYGLNETKRHVIEHMALQEYAGNTFGEVICLIGCAGSGKTSVVNVLAEALGRPFIRIALGGMPDESELRGHRRIYIGSDPSRLVKELIKVKACDPVILLDEVDKLANYRGSPVDALLEILDPEQNSHYIDRYLGFPLDLSKCLFMCTANYEDQIPEPLKDRMNIIHINGYLRDEQEIIIRDYIIPKYALRYKMNDKVVIEDDLIRSLTSGTRMGMRPAEKAIREIYKKSAYQLLTKSPDLLTINVNNCKDLIGYMPSIQMVKKNATGFGS